MASEFLVVAQQILEEEKRPMGPKELVDYALRKKMFSDNIAGKTPSQTMKSKISVDVRRRGNKSLFVRTAPGKFYLRHLLQGPNDVYEAPPLRKPVSKEQVLVFPRAWLHSNRWFQGITKTARSTARELLNSGVCLYMDRYRAERDNEHKQILTYVILTRRGHVLAFRRGNYSRVEDYLRGSQCIQFGGHVCSDDQDLFSTDMGVRECAVRELEEELKLPEIDRRRLLETDALPLVGLLNDDSSEVGQRHFAIIFRYEVSADPAWERPERGEKSVTQLRWLDLSAQPLNLWGFEYWTQLALRAFFRRSVRAAPTFLCRRKTPLKPPHVLCVLGGVGSGKSEATGVLCEEFKYFEINTGQLVARLLGVPPVPRTPRELFQEMAMQFIATANGPDRLAAAIAERVARSDNPRILVDGIRQPATLERLRDRVGRHVGLLFVHTPIDVAFEFYRAREAPNFSLFDFLRVRRAPVEREVEDLIGQSDAVLYNWTGRSEYRRAVRGLMGALLG